MNYVSKALLNTFIFLFGLFSQNLFSQLNLKIDDSQIDRSGINFTQSYAPALAGATPAVVSVTTQQFVKRILPGEGNPIEEFLRRYYGYPRRYQPRIEEVPVPAGIGSGVIVTPDGYTITNAHVITANQNTGDLVEEVLVKVSEKEEYKASIVGYDRSTDVAVLNEGFFYIQPENGQVALSRRGDLGVNAQNQLVNGIGDLVLSDGLEPILLPNFTAMSITDIGEVLVQQPGAPDGEMTSVGFIGSTTSELEQLIKSLDGNIRKIDGTVPDPDQTAKFGQGYLESSNVNAIEELIRNIDMQRQFEINVKLIKKASDLDSAGAKLLDLPT